MTVAQTYHFDWTSTAEFFPRSSAAPAVRVRLYQHAPFVCASHETDDAQVEGDYAIATL